MTLLSKVEPSTTAPEICPVNSTCLKGDRIVAIGYLKDAKTKLIIDAKSLAVVPGFINMLSWSNDALMHDGRGQSEIRQGVTTQIMGEGWSWGPVNPAIKKRMLADQADIKYDIEWTTLSEFLYVLERRGISQNVASFLGATTVREYVLGLENKKPTEAELQKMRQIVEAEMKEGALGIGSALEHAPSYYADTQELIELCKVAAKYRGKYITHMRSEGERLLEGIDEAIRIGKEAKIPVEIYHIKAAGKATGKRWMPPSPKSKPAQRGFENHCEYVWLRSRRFAVDGVHSALGNGRWLCGDAPAFAGCRST